MVLMFDNQWYARENNFIRFLSVIDTIKIFIFRFEE